MKSPNPNQYVLPLDADRHELLAMVRLLRNVDIGLSPGRAEGVVELLERLALLGNDLREVGGVVNVRAQVIAIAARIDCRRTVADRTVRNWRQDAEALGIVRTELRSQQYGRREWNNYAINVSRIRELVAQGVAGSGRKWPETVAAPRPETVAAPRAAMVAAPPYCQTSDKTNDNQAQRGLVVVVSDCGVGRAEEAIERAIANGCTIADIEQRLDDWRRLPEPQRRPGVLFNWLACRGSHAAAMKASNASQPSQPSADAIAKRQAKERDILRWQIVRRGRQFKLPEEEITRQLEAAGVI